MKKIKTLVYGFGTANKFLKILEKDGFLDIKISYDSGLENSSAHFDNLYYSYNEAPQISYAIPLNLYQNLFKKLFPKFMLNYGRLDTIWGKISPEMNIVYMFKYFLNYCYDVLVKNEIELILHTDVPHEILDFMFISLAEELGIKVVVNSTVPYLHKNLMLLRERVRDFGRFNNQKKHNDIKDFGIEDFLQARKYVVDQSMCLSIKMQNLRVALAEENLFKDINKKRLNEFNKILNHITVNEIPKNIKYAYCPLHYQPEASTISFSDSWFEDQSILIEYIAQQLPDDIYIVVKEHFINQTFGWRDPIFYQRLAETKKVIFVSPELKSTDILENAEFAITTAGTVGFEALLMNKPVVYSGNPLYSQIPGAFRFNKNFDINNVLNYNCNREEIETALNSLLQTAYEGLTITNDYKLDCSEEENTNRLVFAYTDYINEIFNNTPNCLEEIRNKYSDLKKISKIPDNFDENIQNRIKNYLPDIEYFKNKSYEAAPELRYLFYDKYNKLFKNYEWTDKEKFEHWYTQLKNNIEYLPVSDKKTYNEVISLKNKILKTKLMNKYKLMDEINKINPEWLCVFEKKKLLEYKIKKTLHLINS